MKMLKCLLTGGEIVTDVFKMEKFPKDEEDVLYYKIHGQYKYENVGIDDSAIGGNKSAEAEDDGEVDDGRILKADILGSLPQSYAVQNKKDWIKHIKKYSKALMDKLGEDDDRSEEEIKKGKERAAYLREDVLTNKFAKVMLKEFGEFQEFYATDGDEFENEGMCVLFHYDGEYPKENTKCYMIVLKDGIIEESL